MALLLRDRHASMWQSLAILSIFNALILKKNFLKNENILQKLEYGFSVERTKIENETFPCKTALSEANVMPCP